MKNRALIAKFIETVNYMTRGKSAVKQKYESFIRFSAHLGVQEFQNNLNTMDKNATYLSHARVDDFITTISTFLRNKTIRDLGTAGNFSILADESTDEANRSQLSAYVRFIDPILHKPTEQFICVRKLSADQTAVSLMNELLNVFEVEQIDKGNLRFSGLDGTNTMSGEHRGLGRRIRHISPHALYLNCRNHRLALCLVHLLIHYPALVELDSVMLCLWKLFKNSTVRTAVFDNAQMADEVKILRAALTRWLTHGKTAIRITSRFKQLIAALDTLYATRRDDDAKGIRDRLLRPTTIMMLLLAEALVPMNIFSCFLQTRHLTYLTAMEKFKSCVSSLNAIKRKILSFDPHANSTPHGLKYFGNVIEFLLISKYGLSSTHDLRDSETVNTVSASINAFIVNVADPFMRDLIKEVETAMDETSPILPAFELFSPRSQRGSQEEREEFLLTLCEYYGSLQSDVFNGEQVVSPAIVNLQEALIECYDFFELFDQTVYQEEERVRNQARRECISTSEMAKYFEANKPNSADIYAALETSYSFSAFPNIRRLFRLSLLIPPSTGNVERGFSTMNLLCTELRSSLNGRNLDALMRICINGKGTFSQAELEEMVDRFKTSNGASTRRISL